MRDSHGATSNEITVQIDVASVVDLPVANSHTFNVDENEPFAGRLQDLASDGDDDIVSFEAIELTDGRTEHGALVVDVDGSFVYTPDPNFIGTDTFEYTVRDSSDNPATGTITLQVVANVVPAPLNDVIRATANAPTEITDAFLTGNDDGGDGDPLQVSLDSPPAHGTLVRHSGGFIYTPAADYVGLDTFTYMAADETDQAVATVWIEVGPLVTMQSGAVALTTAEDNALALKVTRDRTDGLPAGYFQMSVDHGELRLSGVTLTPENSVAYSVAKNGFLYVPAADYHGTATLTVQAGTLDGAGAFVAVGDVQTFSLDVTSDNDAPTATGESTTINEDAPYTFAAGNDVDGDLLTIAILVQPTHGTLSVQQGTAQNQQGNITYTPAAQWNGSDEFSYLVSDGTLTSADRTVSMTVTSVNDTPTIAAPSGEQLTSTGETFVFSASAGTAITFNDVEAGTKRVTLAVNHGRLSYGNSPQAAMITLSGTIAELNSAVDGLQFYAPNDFAGPVQLTITIDDQDVTGGGAQIAVATVLLRVQPRISVSDVSAAENDPTGVLAFTVTLSAASDQTVTVDYQTQNGTADTNDYVAAGGTLTFTPGQTSQTLPITLINDVRDEEDQAFTVLFSSPSNGVLKNVAAAQGMIYDDDNAPLAQAVSTEVLETAGWATVHVVLSQASEKTVSVDWYAVANSAARPDDWTQGTFHDGYNEQVWVDTSITETSGSTRAITATFGTQICRIIRSGSTRAIGGTSGTRTCKTIRSGSTRATTTIHGFPIGRIIRSGSIPNTTKWGI